MSRPVHHSYLVVCFICAAIMDLCLDVDDVPANLDETAVSIDHFTVSFAVMVVFSWRSQQVELSTSAPL